MTKLSEKTRHRIFSAVAAKVSQKRTHFYMRYLPLATAITLTFGVTFDAALADVFSIDDPEVVKGEHTVELNSAFQDSFPVNADPLLNSWELEYTYGLTKWWNVAPRIDFDTPEGDDFHATVAGVENIFSLGEVGDVLALAWFAEIEAGVHRDETNEVTIGPIIQFGGEKASLTLNPYFEKAFGRNHEAGVNFTYGWQVKASLSEHLAFSVEGYGEIPNIADSPGIDFQEHRIGPVLCFEHELRGGEKARTLELEAGILFGLTEATPDVTGKVNAAFVF